MSELEEENDKKENLISSDLSKTVVNERILKISF